MGYDYCWRLETLLCTDSTEVQLKRRADYHSFVDPTLSRKYFLKSRILAILAVRCCPPTLEADQFPQSRHFPILYLLKTANHLTSCMVPRLPKTIARALPHQQADEIYCNWCWESYSGERHYATLWSMSTATSFGVFASKKLSSEQSEERRRLMKDYAWVLVWCQISAYWSPLAWCCCCCGSTRFVVFCSCRVDVLAFLLGKSFHCFVVCVGYLTHRLYSRCCCIVPSGTVSLQYMHWWWPGTIVRELARQFRAIGQCQILAISVTSHYPIYVDTSVCSSLLRNTGFSNRNLAVTPVQEFLRTADTYCPSFCIHIKFSVDDTIAMLALNVTRSSFVSGISWAALTHKSKPICADGEQ